MTQSLKDIMKQAEACAESFSRNISCKVYGLNGGALAVSRFADQFHDISLALQVDGKTFCILDAQASMDKVPYAVCRETLPKLGNLKGLSIYHRAVNREVRRRISRKEGCTHFFELIEFTLASLFSGAPMAGVNGEKSPPPIKNIDPEEHRQKQKNNPWLQNTCLAFKIEKGNEDGTP
jgi:hypothetical protein